MTEEHKNSGSPGNEASDENGIVGPESNKKYPLILEKGPPKPGMKSSERAMPGLPYPVVRMNGSDATDRRINTGDTVMIKTLRGSILIKAEVTGEIKRGYVFIPVDDGDPIRWEECKRDGENMLTDLERLDEILNFSSHRSLVCQVKKKRTRKGVTNQEPSLGCV